MLPAESKSSCCGRQVVAPAGVLFADSGRTGSICCSPPCAATGGGGVVGRGGVFIIHAGVHPPASGGGAAGIHNSKGGMALTVAAKDAEGGRSNHARAYMSNRWVWSPWKSRGTNSNTGTGRKTAAVWLHAGGPRHSQYACCALCVCAV